MSFKQNDTNDNNMIHLGNYEEYFILYMDNELTEEQVKMVDAFLAEHPDLQGEFEMLMSTRLPIEEMKISKEDLLSESMRLTAVDEDLLLFVDNELPANEKKIVELELKSNKDYQLQRELLMKAKLDPSEKIAHPNKKELYRKEERKVAVFALWMRIAAAVAVIAISGVLYLNRTTGSTVSNGNRFANAGKNNQPGQTTNTASISELPKTTKDGQEINVGETIKGDETNPPKQRGSVKKPAANETPDLPKDVISNIASVNKQNQAILNNSNDPVELKNRTAIIENKSFSDGAIAKNEITPSEIVNNSAVTSAIANRKTVVDAAEKENENVASKGSVKGFLRKTTRLIEKRTGIDPTSDGELLIGAVAINLK